MKVAVTGASGHLGANVVRALLERGREVLAVTEEPPHRPVPALERLDVERRHADIRDAEAVRRALTGADVVYHLAAKISIVNWDAESVWAVNVGGTANVVDACLANDVRRLVHVSSYHAFSPDGRRATDEQAPASVAPELPAYARSKAFGQRIVQRGIERGLDAVVVNPTGLMGPWDYKPSMMGQLIVDACRGRLPAIVPGGANIVDVRDIATTLVEAERRGQTGVPYLVGGSWVSIAEIVELACSFVGRRPRRLVTPTWLARAVAPVAETFSRVTRRQPRLTEQTLIALDHHRLVLDGRAMDELGHRARPIEQTIADTCEWFAGRGMLRVLERPSVPAVSEAS